LKRSSVGPYPRARYTLSLSLLVLAVSCGGKAPGDQLPRPAAPVQPPRLGTPSSGYDFAYDAAGRLVVVTAPTGEAAQYVYDPAGNILAIQRIAAGGLSIVGFSPVQGAPGQLVTVTGVGFSAVPAENVVRVNGTTATVLSSTSAQLTFTVPAGATTGLISVTVAGVTANSATSFVVFDAAVAISSFTPNFGVAGTAVAISGHGFDPAPIDDTLAFNQTQAFVTAATATTLQTSVPPAAQTGPLRLQSTFGSALSTTNFVVVPAGIAAANVVSAADIGAIGGSATAVIGTAGKISLIDFPGIAGTRASLYVSNLTFPSATAVAVYAPQGNVISNSGVGSGTATKIDLGILPATGNYVIEVIAGAGSTGSLTAQVFFDATAANTVDAAATSLSLATGQNGDVTFDGLANDVLGFSATFATVPASSTVNFQLLKPDGSVLGNCSLAPSNNCSLPPLPAAGTYTLRVLPSGVASFSGTVQLSRPITGAIAQDGTPVQFQSSRAGQAARYSFTATAGQTLTLDWSGVPNWPHQLFVSVVRVSDGATIMSDWWGTPSHPSWDAKYDLLNLAAGNYVVVVQPTGNDTGALTTLHLWAETAVTAPVDGASAPMTGGTAQDGRYSFTGNAGDFIGLAVTALTTTPAGTNVGYAVMRPDGTALITCSFTSPGSCQLPALPVTGTYTIRVVPAGVTSFSTTILLSRAINATIAMNGTPATFVPARAGQMVRYSFTATAGQNFSLEWNGTPPWPNQVFMTVFRPDGTIVLGDWWGTSSHPSWDFKYDLLNLVAGTYTITVVPGGTDTGGSTSLRLWPDSTAVIPVDGAAAAMSAVAGQNGRYTFAGTAGDLLGFAVTALTTTPAGANVAYSLFRPDGAQIQSCSFSAPGSCQLTPLTVTGTYTIRVVPPGITGFTTSAMLSHPVTGTVAVDGTPTTYVPARPAQTARYTFTATAGQNFSLEWSGSPTWANQVFMTVFRPDGSSALSDWWGTSSHPSWDAKYDLLGLAAGTYTIVFTPGGLDTGGSSTVRLWPDSTAPVAENGTAVSLSSVSGENGRYAFTGTAGDQLGFAATALTTTPANANVDFRFLRPDGSQFANCTFNAPNSCQLPALPSTGTYTVRVVPAGTAGFSTSILLSTPLTGSIAVDGTATTFTAARSGQTGRYSFTIPAGQLFSLEWACAAPWPHQFTMTVLNSSGGGVVSDWCGTSSFPTWDGKYDLATLAAGNYVITLVPTVTDTGGSSTLRIWPEVSAAITVDGAAVPITIPAGRNGRYTFTANAGDLLGMGVTAFTTTPASQSFSFNLLKSDGTSVASCQLSAAGPCQFPALPITGTYSLRVVTNPASKIAALSTTIILSRPASGALASDSTLTQFAATRAAQTARYPFTLAAGQKYSLEWICTGPWPDQMFMTVLNSSGASVVSDWCGTAAWNNWDGKYDLAGLAAGNYVITYSPTANDTGGTAGARIWPEVNASVTVNGAAVPMSVATGQNGRYSFTGSVGDVITMNVSAITTPAAASVAFTVLRPDGTTTVTTCSKTATGTCVFPALPVAGTYAIRVVPTQPPSTLVNGPSSSVTISLSKP
jgi:YD repeat-containing protein